MKKFLCLILVLMMTLSVAICFGGCNSGDKDNAETVKKLTVTGEDNKYTLYSFNGDDAVLDIDAEIKKQEGENAQVVKIKTGAFKGNGKTEEIIVPTTVNEIEAGAFEKMTALKKITLPFVGQYFNADSVIGSGAKAEDKAVDSARIFSHIFGTEEYEGGSQIKLKFNETENGSVTAYVPMTLRTVKIAPKESYTLPAYAFSGLTMIKVELDSIVNRSETAFLDADESCIPDEVLVK